MTIQTETDPVPLHRLHATKPVSVLSSYHPEFMYCMACSSCNSNSSNTQPIDIAHHHQTTGEDTNSMSKSDTNEAHDGTEFLSTRIENVHVPGKSPQETGIVVGRTTLYVKGICCSSEVPTVTQILKQISTMKQGLIYFPITKVSINITSRLVYVEHDIAQITAEEMARYLNQEGFHATIQSDGSKKHHKDLKFNPVTNEECQNQQRYSTSITSSISDISKSRFVESTFIYPAMMSSSIDLTRSIRSLLKTKKYMPDKIRTFYCHVASKTIKIEHDPQQVSATTIAELLSSSSLNLHLHKTSSSPWNVKVHIDGAIEGLHLPMHLDHEINTDTNMKQKDFMSSRYVLLWSVISWARRYHLNIIFSGIFWILSMIGELFSNL